MGGEKRSIQKKIRELCKEHAQEVVEALLEIPFWPQRVCEGTSYQRCEDDSRQGAIHVVFASGDGWLEIFSESDPEDPHHTMRFRSYYGGGESERVRNALLILAVAIQKDNEACPQNRLKEEP